MKPPCRWVLTKPPGRRAGLGAMAGLVLLATAPAARAQILQDYLPDVAAPAIGQAGPAIAPDVTATPRGAAEIQPADTVTTRAHPDYATAGVHVGDFYVRPQLTESGGYNSNLFADTSGRGAAFVNSAPGLSFASDWARNSIRGGVLVDNTVYPSQSAQNFTNVNANAGGTYDIGRTQLRAQFTHGSVHIARGTIDAGNFDRPIPFQIDRLNVSYLIPFARVSFEPEIDFYNFRFQNGTFRGPRVLETVNDRNVGQAVLTTRYELAPLRSLVLVLRGTTQNFYNSQGTIPQNSKSGEILAGIDFNLNAIFRVRALFGYEVRSFTSAAFETRSAPIFNADVVWTPTTLTTVTLSVNRSIEDALASVTNGFTYTSGKLSVDHELLRNVLLNAHTQAELADFTANQGTTDVYSVGGMATWRLNRNVSVIGRFDYANRQASAAQGASYSQNLVLLGMGLRL